MLDSFLFMLIFEKKNCSVSIISYHYLITLGLDRSLKLKKIECNSFM